MKYNKLIVIFLFIGMMLSLFNLFYSTYSYQVTIHKVMGIVMCLGLIFLFSRNFITWVFSLVFLIPCTIFFSYEIITLLKNKIFTSRMYFPIIYLVCCTYAVFHVLKYLFTTDKKE